MPVWKYRSIEDMPEPAWRTPGDPELYRALAALWDTSRRLRPRRYPAGVYRHRSMEDMNRQREEWDREFVQSLRRAPGGPRYPNGLRVIDSAVIDDVVERIVHRFQPKRIAIFGSVARGDAGPDSDLDLFVEMESDLRFLDRCIAVRRCLIDLEVPMDVFVYTPAEVAERRGQIGSLISYVEQDGKTVYEHG